MKKQSLFWIAPAIAVALTLAYIAKSPETTNGPDDRLARAAPETAAQSESNDDRQVGEGNEVSEGESAPAAVPVTKNCTIVTHYLPIDDGTVTEVYSCEPVSPEVRHPYESYSDDALASLAYSDAKAAEVLGMRLREDDEKAAISLIFRASALSGGDAEPILAYSNAYPHPSSVDGVPNRKTIHTKFVMSAVAELLGSERNDLGYWENQIREFSSDPEKEIALLRAQAEKIIDQMRQIQLNVTGTSSIGGQGDA